ncbi:unnamed protein product [marine sediment metagenome]|uniref:CheW-like domain-containing protein n=1 Tax=marine sediment metagenome TaxID=412755 RepID=X0UMH7_9ZZZZ
MAQSAETKANKKTLELATFYVGEALCGMDILKIQEINKLLEMTEVPQAPEYVKGILNLRGQIVTVIDLGRKLDLSPTQVSGTSRNIIVNSTDEYIGLLVDRISDVERADWDKIEHAPANIGGIQGKFFEGVFKSKDHLIGILNAEEVLKGES